MLTASAQKYVGNLASSNIVLPASIRVLFFLSTTPFCWGVPGAENCWVIPLTLQNSSITEFLNSVPLSLLRILTLYLVPVSISLTWSSNISAVSSFLWRKYTQVNLVNSSTMTRVYLFLLMDMTFTGPNKSRWSMW